MRNFRGKKIMALTKMGKQRVGQGQIDKRTKKKKKRDGR